MTCYNWTPSRCTHRAAFWLIAPYGKRIPGGWFCVEHGRAVVKEYAEKLGERWTLQPIDEYGAALAHHNASL